MLRSLTNSFRVATMMSSSTTSPSTLAFAPLIRTPSSCNSNAFSCPSAFDMQDTLRNSLMTNTQVRHRRKKKVKSRRHIAPVYNDQWGNPNEYTWDTKGLERRRRSAGLRPQYRDILIVRDFKFGLTGQTMRLKAKHAFKLATQVPPVAVFYTPELYQKHVIDGIVKEKFNGDLEAFKTDLSVRMEQFRTRYLLQRIAVKFQRRIDGPGKEFKFPITKKDLANRIWNLVKVPLKEEQIALPGHFPDRPITKPGYYKCWVTLNDGNDEKVKLRVYLDSSGTKLQGY